MRKQLLLALGSVALGVVVVGGFAIGQGGGESSSVVSRADNVSSSESGARDALCPHKGEGELAEAAVVDFMEGAQGRWATPEEAVRWFVKQQRIPHDRIEDKGRGMWQITNNGRNEATVSLIEQPLGGFDVKGWSACSTRSERFPEGKRRQPKTPSPSIDSPATDTAR